MGQNYFQKENLSVMEGLETFAQEGRPVKLRTQNKLFYRARIVSIGNRIKLKLEDDSLGLKTESTAIVIYEFAEKKYFVGGQVLDFNQDIFTFESSTDLYYVQRRADFRVKLPKDMNAHFEIMYPEKYVPKKPVMTDLSAGGCMLVADPVLCNDVQIEDHLKGEVHIFGYDTIAIEGVVRYKRGDEGIGIEFFNLQPSAYSTLGQVVSEIQIQLFKTAIK